VSGITGTQAELLYVLAAPVTKASVASQAVIGPLAASANVPVISGGMLSQQNPNPVGRAFYLQAFGSLANAATGATFIPALGIDPTVGTPANQIAFCTAYTPAASTTLQWEMESWITCQLAGLSGGMTLQVNGSFSILPGAVGGALSTAMPATKFASNITGLLASATYYTELLATWSATGATTTVQQIFMWGLN